MKVLLTTLNSKFIHTNLALRYIRECSKDIEDIDLKEYTINNSLDYILKDIYRGNYDLVAFSVYIWNVEDVEKICENLKKVSPNVKIAFGGPEVSYNTDKVMEKYDFVDFVMAGEGEFTFRELLLSLKGKMPLEEVDGITFRKNGEIIVNRERDLIANLDDIPSPYDDINPEEYKNKIVYYESSRGCPFNCQYCLSSAIKGLRFFSLDRVKKDLKALLDAGVAQIKFIDRTFNADKRKSKEIMKFLMENDNGFTTSHFEVTAHLIDDDMLEFLKQPRPGLFQFEIGVQTTNKAVLLEVGRTDDFKKLSRVVKIISGYRNIHQHLDLIAGLPNEDMDSFRKSFDDVYNVGIEVLQLGFLKLIKGTGIRERSDYYDYEFRDYPPYEVLSSNKMSFSDLLRLKDIEEILETYYNSGNFILSVNYFQKNYFESPFDFYDSFAEFFNRKGYFDMSHSRNALFDIFLEFMIETDSENEELFRELLKFDYCSAGRLSGSPDFYRKVEVENMKDRSHKFLQNDEYLKKYVPEKAGVPAKKLIKNVYFEAFSYDVASLKENYTGEVKKETNVVMFDYDIDKIFEKSHAYRVDEF